jgi:hypothetical protein
LIIALEEKGHAFEEAKRQYAQMTVDEEGLDNEVSGKDPQRLSAANHFRKTSHRGVEEVDSSGEFDFGEVDALGSELESDAEPVKKKKVTTLSLKLVLMILTVVRFRERKAQRWSRGRLERRLKYWHRIYVVIGIR